MATKSCLLLFSLVVLTGVSAQRPYLVDRNQASEGASVPRSAPTSNLMGERPNLVDRNQASEVASVPRPAPTSNVMGQRPNLVDRNQASEGASVPRPAPTSNVMGNVGNNGKVPDIGNRMKASGMTFGMIPIPIPGADGQFQFQIGPIGFGANWNFGFLPGPLYSYNQPIVVSPYSPPLGTPSPYLPPASMPQPGTFQPWNPYYMPIPVGGVDQGFFGDYGQYPFGPYAPGTDKMGTPNSEHK